MRRLKQMRKGMRKNTRLIGLALWLACSLQAASVIGASAGESALSEAERQQLLSEAKPLLRKECFRQFERYLDAPGSKSFFYAIDGEGRYACGNSSRQEDRQVADDAALADCLRDRSRRGARMPKITCRQYARENDLLLTQRDFGLEITPLASRALTPEEFRAAIDTAEAVLGVKCLAEFKLYLNSEGHKAFYYARDRQGRYACGSADAAIADSAAQRVALKHCDTHRDKEKVQTNCKLYAKANEIVAGIEDFPLEEKQDPAR